MHYWDVRSYSLKNLFYFSYELKLNEFQLANDYYDIFAIRGSKKL